EGLMMCVLAPTAAASAVVTMKLGGDGANNTTYVLISSMAVAIIAPLLFPIIHPMPEHPNFWIACWSILKRVMPVLIGPFVLATILHIILPKVHEKLATWHEVSFYLWSLCLVFAAAQTVEALLQEKSQTGIELLLAGFSGIICIILFSIGKHVGGIYGKRISGGQSLGQKNVVLAIWIAQSYLTPIASTGLGAYIIWQNIFNSYQLWKKRQEEQKGNEHPSDFELIP
ncbi:MAG: bile acid:sodium symporter, partial [Bacteroidales bacterium]